MFDLINISNSKLLVNKANNRKLKITTVIVVKNNNK